MYMTSSISATWLLAEKEAHVWLVPVSQSETIWAERLGMCSQQERGLILSMNPSARRQRAIAWGVRREILASYLNCRPESLDFAMGEHGKPRVAGAMYPEIDFNLSYSEHSILFGLARGCRIGVDVEASIEINFDEVVRTFLSAREITEWERLASTPERKTAFYQAWTRKEAYLKACGVGLLRSPTSLEVSFCTGSSPAIVSCARDPEASARWKVVEICIEPATIGSVVVESSVVEIKVHNYGSKKAGSTRLDAPC